MFKSNKSRILGAVVAGSPGPVLDILEYILPKDVGGNPAHVDRDMIADYRERAALEAPDGR